MAMEKILEGIELNHPSANENSTYDVFVKDKSAKKPTFVAKEVNGTEQLIFELSGDPKLIAKNFRKPILKYRLATVTDEDQVSLADIFMYGKFNLLVDHNLD
jgi:hypothetical protein